MSHETEKLLDLVTQRMLVLQELYELSEEQMGFVRKEQVSQLLPHLAKKQKHLEKFAALQEELRPFASQPAASRRWASEDLRQQCQEYFDEGERLLAAMMEMEQEAEATLMVSRDSLAERMRQSTGSQHAASAYRQADENRGPSRLDLSSSD
ncbi:hypothetical protein FF011L_42630 [Roseimaritima multifibrata]|uniref:FlgN protein n=1 Tax=Roseimaritima multifibrata TaxID=1930274 RepID=A0A517ML18_9BACT|nr:hypothetical protein [Roseimaritima multifibrata]QDS95467.1 hypothetical protein FF011L_42630 [Roseimaritima multifibrata]